MLPEIQNYLFLYLTSQENEAESPVLLPYETKTNIDWIQFTHNYIHQIKEKYMVIGKERLIFKKYNSRWEGKELAFFILIQIIFAA